MESVSIIIPSRKRNSQLKFLETAVASINKQSVADRLELSIIVGVDKGDMLDDDVCSMLGVRCVESQFKTQAHALNAASANVDSDYIAFLEDDDQWMPHFLEIALMAIKRADFVSSTQLEHDENNNILRINDYPTPSGWFMRTTTFRKVGDFDTDYIFHLDNEWLGRLNKSGAKRIHLVESTAPNDIDYAQQVRPWLANVLMSANGLCKLARHSSPLPLIKRLALVNFSRR